EGIKEVRVPDVGGAEAVEVIEISVASGDQIVKDEALLVLESDKASMDIPSPYTGVVSDLKVKVGDKLSEGDLIALIQSEKSDSDVKDAGSDVSSGASSAKKGASAQAERVNQAEAKASP
ncbi:biotin/lipoyl-containing protein, partial [Oleiphilus sp. HI0079]